MGTGRLRTAPTRWPVRHRPLKQLPNRGCRAGHGGVQAESPARKIKASTIRGSRNIHGAALFQGGRQVPQSDFRSCQIFQQVEGPNTTANGAATYQTPDMRPFGSLSTPATSRFGSITTALPDWEPLRRRQVPAGFPQPAVWSRPGSRPAGRTAFFSFASGLE